MPFRKVLVVTALASAFFSWANAQTQAPAPTAAPAETSKPPGGAAPDVPLRTGKDILETSCTGCHDLGVLTATPHTAEDWPVVLNRMVGNGLNITPEDMKTVQAYLVEHYSSEPGAH